MGAIRSARQKLLVIRSIAATRFPPRSSLVRCGLLSLRTVEDMLAPEHHRHLPDDQDLGAEVRPPLRQ